MVIDRTPISDSGLVHLKGLTQLNRLYLGGSSEFTANGVADLQKALPNCRVQASVVLPTTHRRPGSAAPNRRAEMGSKNHYVSEAAFRENTANQSTMTPQTLEQLRKYGVTDASQLALEFFFYTDTETKAAALAKALSVEGYSVKHGASASDVVITGWTTKMSMDELTIVEWTTRMCKLGFDHDCEFDGWGTNPNQD